MTAIVRRAALEDGDRLYGLWCAIRDLWVSNDRRIRMAPVGQDEFVAGLGEYFARPTVVVFVAEDGGRLTGFVSGGVERNAAGRLPELHGTISYLYVAEAQRREGVGRRLFEALRDWVVQQEGVSHLEMPVLANYHAADGFWRAIGFSPFIERLWAPIKDATLE